MKLGDHKMKIKTYLATEETIKRVLSNYLKLVLFKTAWEHIREAGGDRDKKDIFGKDKKQYSTLCIFQAGGLWQEFWFVNVLFF